MAVGKYFALFLGLTLTASAIGGCEGMTMDQVFGIGDSNPATELTPPPPPPPPPPTPIPTPKPTPQAAHGALKRNMAFDHLRLDGMTHVYEGKTKVAVGIFQAAQRMKPEDVSVKLWLTAIQKSAEAKRAQMVATLGSEFKNTNGQVQNNAPPGVQPPPVVPPGAGGGRMPAGALPQPAQSPVAPDPRLVF